MRPTNCMCADGFDLQEENGKALHFSKRKTRSVSQRKVRRNLHSLSGATFPLLRLQIGLPQRDRHFMLVEAWFPLDISTECWVEAWFPLNIICVGAWFPPNLLLVASFIVYMVPSRHIIYNACNVEAWFPLDVFHDRALSSVSEHDI